MGHLSDGPQIGHLQRRFVEGDSLRANCWDVFLGKVLHRGKGAHNGE